MYSRIAIRLAAPLVLTLLVVVAAALSWPSAALWAILTTMVLSWLVFAWWSVHSQSQRSPEHAKVLKEQDQLLNELRSFVSNEIDGSRSEIERARELIRQAVGGLGGSFDAMSRKSRQQSQALARIVDRAGHRTLVLAEAATGDQLEAIDRFEGHFAEHGPAFRLHAVDARRQHAAGRRGND